MTDNWETCLEWEQMDITPDMVIPDPLIKKMRDETINKALEERKKVEEADNELTNELFDVEPKKESIKEKGAVVLKKMKSSGIKLVDEVIKKTKSIKNVKIAPKQKSFKLSQKRKIYDEYTLNNVEDKSIDIEDKYLNSKKWNG